ncbi:MAG: Gfo/Idh/MocA family oxidoreductase [Cytophagaceae bacterium]
MSGKIRVGLVGFGVAGEVFHAPFITNVPDLELTKVVERHNEKSKSIYPWVEIVRDYRNLLTDPEIDLIVIATPNDVHYSIAKEALFAGKHVLVDKPFTLTWEEAKDLVQVQKSTGKVLTVYQNRRLDAGYQSLRKLLIENKLGKIQNYYSCFDRYRPEIKNRWREQDFPGAGLLYDLGVHLIDQVVYLFGMPEAIQADIRNERPMSVVDDFFDIELDYGDFKARVSAGMLVSKPGPSFIVEGEKGIYYRKDLDPQEKVLKEGLHPGDSRWEENTKAEDGWIEFKDGRKEMVPAPTIGYINFYKNLANVIAGNESLLVSPEVACNVIKLINLAQKSSKENKKLNVADGLK